MNIDEMVVAAGKDTAFELYLASGEDNQGNMLDLTETDNDPKKI